MEPRLNQRRSWLFFFGLNAPAFSIAMIHIVNNPNLYHFILTDFIDRGLLTSNRINTAMGALGILGLLVAGITQPAIGYLSDRTRTPLGSRYPYFLGGAAASVAALLFITHADSWLILLIAVMVVQVALNAMQSPMQALIPDQVHASQMGIAASIKTVLELLGIIMSGVIVWVFLGDNTRPTLAVLASGIILFLSIFLAMRVAPPHTNVAQPIHKTTSAERYMRRYMAAIGSPIRVRMSLFQHTVRRMTRQRSILWWFASRFFFYSSFNAIGKLAVNYLTDVYGYSGESARAIQGQVLVGTGIAIFFATMLAGVLADRLDRRYIAAAGGVISAVAAILLLSSPELTVAAILIGIVGIGSGIFLSVGWALITNIAPMNEAALYLGMANIATTLGGAFGLLGGYLIDQVNLHTNSINAGYQVLFAITALFFLLGSITVMRVIDSQNGNST